MTDRQSIGVEWLFIVAGLILGVIGTTSILSFIDSGSAKITWVNIASDVEIPLFLTVALWATGRLTGWVSAVLKTAPLGRILQAGAIGFGTSVVLGLALAPGIGVSAGLLAITERAILAPVAEELLFRGYILWSANRAFGERVAVMGSSVLFGILHYTNGWISMCVATTLGLYFATATLRSRSIYPAMLGHILFNATQIVFTEIT